MNFNVEMEKKYNCKRMIDMNREKILIELLELIRSTYKVSENILIPQNFNDPLTGKNSVLMVFF